LSVSRIACEAKLLAESPGSLYTAQMEISLFPYPRLQQNAVPGVRASGDPGSKIP